MTTDRSAGKWILAQPEDVIEDEDFLPIPRIARTIPFGYKEDPEDTDILLPIPRELRALEKAKEYLQQYSYRERSATLRVWAERYKTAINKAEEIERTKLGARKSQLTTED